MDNSTDPVLNTQIINSRKSVESGRILARNKNLSYIIALTHNVGFLTPIWVIFGIDRLGLSLTLSLVLGTTSWVSSSIFEVPLGAFSDKYGRKLSLIFGFSLNALGCLSLVAFTNFYVLMMFQVFAGVGYALTSGSLEGLLHDTFEEQGAITQYAKLSSRMLSLLNISRIATIPVGAWLYNLDINAKLTSYTYPYIANALTYMISMLCVVFLIEKRSSHKQLDKVTEFGGTKSLFSHATTTWKLLMANRDSKRVVILLGIYSFIGEGNWALIQSYFRERGVSVYRSSVVYMIIMGFMALGAIVVTRVYKTINVMWAMNIIIGLMAVIIAALHLPINIAYMGFVVIGLVGPMSWYLQDNAIQNRMSGDYKTTALSITSMVYNLGATVGVYGVGALANNFGVLKSQWIFVGYGATAFVLMGLWCAKDGFGVREEDARALFEEAPFDDVVVQKP
ncbi:MAG: MFS transporter [Acidimicrobiia bacterium]